MNAQKKNIITWLLCSVVWIVLLVNKVLSNAGWLAIGICGAVSALSIACLILNLKKYIEDKNKSNRGD